MIGYLTMTLTASALLRWAENRMDGSDSYELVQADPLVMTAGTYSHPGKGTPFDERSREYDLPIWGMMFRRAWGRMTLVMVWTWFIPMALAPSV